MCPAQQERCLIKSQRAYASGLKKQSTKNKKTPNHENIKKQGTANFKSRQDRKTNHKKQNPLLFKNQIQFKT